MDGLGGRTAQVAAMNRFLTLLLLGRLPRTSASQAHRACASASPGCARTGCWTNPVPGAPRRIATRDEKRAACYLAMVTFGMILLWL